MPYPDNFSSAELDRSQGRDEDDEAAGPEDCYDAARGFLDALDRGWVTVNRPDSAYLAGLREAVAAETANRMTTGGGRA